MEIVLEAVWSSILAISGQCSFGSGDPITTVVVLTTVVVTAGCDEAVVPVDSCCDDEDVLELGRALVELDVAIVVAIKINCILP